MLGDLIKRMVITEKYIYLNDDDQDQFEMRLQKFKDTQIKQEQLEKDELNTSENNNETEVETDNQVNTKNIIDDDNINMTETERFKRDNRPKVRYPTYAFDLDVRLTKPQIKALLEKVFNVDIVSINTYIAPMKKKRVGFNQGYKAKYKRAIIKLKLNQKINNPLD